MNVAVDVQSQCMRSLSSESKLGRGAHLADVVGPREGAEELQPRGVLPGCQHHLLHLHDTYIPEMTQASFHRMACPVDQTADSRAPLPWRATAARRRTAAAAASRAPRRGCAHPTTPRSSRKGGRPPRPAFEAEHEGGSCRVLSSPEAHARDGGTQ